MDFAFPVTSDDGTMEGTAYETLNQTMVEGLSRVGRDGGIPNRYKALLTDAGFQSITEVRYKWPQNTWPKDKHLKKIGEWNMVNTLDGLYGFAARLCIQVMGMTPEQLEVLLAAARKDITNPKIHSYWSMYVTPLHEVLKVANC